MMRSLFKFICLIAISLFVSCNLLEDNSGLGIEAIEDITFGCIDYKPFTHKDSNGEIIGMETAMLKAAAEKISVDPSIEMFDSWGEAYDATLNGQMRGLITTTYTPERADLFKWAGPLNRVAFVLFSKKSLGIEFGSIDEAKTLGSIAVIKDWAATAELVKLGFTNLVEYSTASEVVTAVMNGNSEAFIHSIPVLRNRDDIETLFPQLRAHFVYHTSFHYIAFSKDVPDEIVNAYQTSIDQLLIDGTATTIRNEYGIKNMVPYGKIQIFTEEFPPLNMSNGLANASITGKLILDGSSTEIVNAVQKYLGVNNPIYPTQWYSAYSVVQYLPYSALYSTIRSQDREGLFQWVGPIATSKSNFYALKSSKIAINSIDDAKNHTVVVVRDWAEETTLINHGFTNYKIADDLDSMVEMFLNGEADILFTGEISMNYLTQEYGIENNELESYSFFESYDYYIAFSLATPKSVVNNWQTALDALKQNGTFETIWNKWHSGI